MAEEKIKRILYLDHNFYMRERYENKEYKEVIGDIEIYGACNVEKAKEIFREFYPFDLIGIHLSTSCAFFFATYVRERYREIPIIVLSGVASYAKKTLDDIEFPYDQILNIPFEPPEDTAKSLVNILHNINRKQEMI
ncbi:hypothetical protein HYV89_02115 [Candidatus Woesearchaeota archaeon]|nr:hypothetical protein [Candidatus Woesearchaeota archaeon]